MNSMAVLDQIARGDFHREGGLRCLRLFTVEPEFFSSLVKDVQTLAVDNMPSEVQSEDHVTNWTRPIGRAVQFSLLNASGDFSDTSVDHDKKSSGKSFHHADRYPTLGQFIDLVPGATNMRLNGMSPGGGLSPHEEHVTRRKGRNYYLRARFHLPIATNPDAVVLLDGQWFHFEPGEIYFFNNGCVHSAMNGGHTQRYHLVWDMTLTEEVIERMFGDDSHGPLEHVPASGRAVSVHHTDPPGEYAISGFGERLYNKLRVDKLGVKPHTWQNGYQRAAYAAFATAGQLRYDSLR